jgi:hypothetical protein
LKLVGRRYKEGFNLFSIVVATVGAILPLSVFGGIRTSSTARWEHRRAATHLRHPIRRTSMHG